MIIKQMLSLLLHKRQLYAEDIINKKREEEIAATLSLTQDEIYNSMYHEVKELFQTAMRSRRLTREQILYIKNMLNGFLKPYSRYYSQRYKNDAHEIYSKLKSPFLSNKEYQKISSFILNCIRIY
jgi:hypothetical protein